MDVGNSKMVEMCVKWEPGYRVFQKKKNQAKWIPKPLISKMIKWPEAEADVGAMILTEGSLPLTSVEQVTPNDHKLIYVDFSSKISLKKKRKKN